MYSRRVLSVLKMGQYARRVMNFEHEVIESVIDTNYRWSKYVDPSTFEPYQLSTLHLKLTDTDINVSKWIIPFNPFDKSDILKFPISTFWIMPRAKVK